MDQLRLIIRNLCFFRKANLTILAGVIIGTSVLTGALIVGDSVRYSLQQITKIRLGKIRFALSTEDRFFRQDLAEELSRKTRSDVVPAMESEAIAINSDNNQRINQVHVIGINDHFGYIWDNPACLPRLNEAILSRNTAEKLGLKTGDRILLRIYKPGKASPNAPFVADKLVSVSKRVRVAAIADDNRMGRFSLKNNQVPPFNVFIPLTQMADLLELDGLSNMMLVNDNDSVSAWTFNEAIKRVWKMEDIGLKKEHSVILTDRIFISDPVAHAVLSAIPEGEGILTYLVNSISVRGRSTPYSFITAQDDTFSGQPLAGNEILISSWLAEDLRVKTGDSLMLRYFIISNANTLAEDSSVFIIRKILPLENAHFDRDLMPAFPGISDAESCRDWETGSPVDLRRIRKKDEQYWNQYRGTPKGFIALKTGQKIWKNPFGSYTAIRIPHDTPNWPATEKIILTKIQPIESGLIFRPVRDEGMYAASQSTDFGTLFLSLGFFIILAALLLTSLLFALQVTTRTRETGILTILGFRKDQIRNILLSEAAIIAVLGGIMGSIAGIGCNKLLLLGLNTLWRDAVRTSSIVPCVDLITLLTGALSGIAITLVSLSLTLNRILRKSIVQMIKGNALVSPDKKHPWKKIHGALALLFTLLAFVIIALAFPFQQGTNPVLFMSAGFLLLIGGIAGLNYGLDNVGGGPGISSDRFYGIILKNAALNRHRTLAAITLLALGTFSIIITGANRKTAGNETSDPCSGTGGFLLWAESTFPVRTCLNSPEGKQKEGLADEPELKGLHYFQVRQIDGDDASCLNLNQVSQPKVLGVRTDYLDKIKAFSFASLGRGIDQAHPWKALDSISSPGVIPAFADQTVITWGLRKKIGDTLVYRSESGEKLYIRLAGGLDNSIFQGNLLISDSLMRFYFPSANSSKIILVNGPESKKEIITTRLEYLFRDRGMMVTPATERLAAFNSVENTYLSVFIILGGLGVILGTFGMGIVLLRNLYERKQELALYLVLGFRKNFILKLLIAEHLFILFTGILLGLIPALAGIFPSLVSPVYQFPWITVLSILLLILLSGLVCVGIPLLSLFKRDLIPALRSE
ncbi:MAG: ABC transporter permease [Bacteroidales bacterium]|nr:ABC transporter permease [Bacteroidales bacterium]